MAYKHSEIHSADGQFDLTKTDEITLVDLGRVLLRGWRSLAIAIAIGLVIGIIANHLVVRSYVASVFVAPVDATQNARSSRGLQTVATLAGIDLNANHGVNAFEEFQVLLGSPVFAAQFDRQHGYLKRIYAGLWDQKDQRWLAYRGFMGWVKSIFRAALGAEPPGPPSPQNLAALLKGAIDIAQVEDTSLYKISYSNPDPKFAAEFLNNVLRDTDREIKGRRIAVAARSVAYLRRRIAEENSVELRTALAGLDVGQEQQLMMLKGDAPTALEIIDGVSVTNTPTTPTSIQVIALPVLFFAIIGLLLAFFEGWLRTTDRFDDWRGRMARYLPVMPGRPRSRWS